LSNVVIPNGLVYSVCTGGQYTDEATGVNTSAPSTRAAMIYSGTGDLALLASPLSEIAYQLAGTNLASTITAKNAEVAAAFGLNSVDVISTIPTDINTTAAANDDAGKIATILAAISQMGENAADANPTATITALVNDMKGSGGTGGGTIEGRGSVDIATALNNFKTNSGDNNDSDGTGAGNINSSVGKGSLSGDLAIAFIAAYDGTGTAPTVQQYDDADVTGVDANNLAAVNAAVANQTAGTTAQIQALANTVTITIAFEATTSDAVEANTGLNLVVDLSAASGQAVTVNYTVTGTATGSGTDYTLANGTATIAAGSTSTNIVLAIVEDALDETNETVIVTLSSPSNATLGANTAHTHTITDDDATTYVIGDTGPAGGFVFYISDGGLHGLEAALTDQETGQWGCDGTSISGADGTAVGTGEQNTMDIIAGCNETSAASAASDYEPEPGWYLPSKDELNLLYSQKDVVGGFPSNNYWSSSQYNSGNAWLQNFGNGWQGGGSKFYTSGVRAVRAF
jgi:hypothetical protein